MYRFLDHYLIPNSVIYKLLKFKVKIIYVTITIPSSFYLLFGFMIFFFQALNLYLLCLFKCVSYLVGLGDISSSDHGLFLLCQELFLAVLGWPHD